MKQHQSDTKGSTRSLLGIRDITDYSLQTPHGELVFFIIKPSNISVLSEASIGTRIYALMTVLKGMVEIEMLCLNSRENFEDNKRNIRARMEQEQNHIIRKLLESDMTYLDRIQVQMATAREFLILIRLRNEKQSDTLRRGRFETCPAEEHSLKSYLNRIEKSIKEQGFAVSRAGKEDIKRLLAVYFEQNVTSERFEDFDGERWIIFND